MIPKIIKNPSLKQVQHDYRLVHAHTRRHMGAHVGTCTSACTCICTHVSTSACKPKPASRICLHVATSGPSSFAWHPVGAPFWHLKSIIDLEYRDYWPCDLDYWQSSLRLNPQNRVPKAKTPATRGSTPQTWGRG